MPPRFELVVFDWDGTLMDSEEKIVRCFSAAAADVGLPDPGRDAVRNIIGLGLSEAMQALYPGLAATAQEQLVERYREHFLHRDRTAMPLFPGVAEGLAALTGQGYLLAIATGKARRGLDRVLEQTNTAHYFAVTRCVDEAYSKPHPKMLEDILDRTGVAADDAIMIGDTVYDMQMAASAGVAALAVSYGVHEKERLLHESPLACLDSFTAVRAWLS